MKIIRKRKSTIYLRKMFLECTICNPIQKFCQECPRTSTTVARHKWVPKMTYIIALSSPLFTVKLRVNCKRKNNIPWHTVNLHGPDCWLEYFLISFTASVLFQRLTIKFNFLLFCFYFFNFQFKTWYLQNPRSFFSKVLIYYLPTLPINYGIFWPW